MPHTANFIKASPTIFHSQNEFPKPVRKTQSRSMMESNKDMIYQTLYPLETTYTLFLKSSCRSWSWNWSKGGKVRETVFLTFSHFTGKDGKLSRGPIFTSASNDDGSHFFAAHTYTSTHGHRYTSDMWGCVCVCVWWKSIKSVVQTNLCCSWKYWKNVGKVSTRKLETWMDFFLTIHLNFLINFICGDNYFHKLANMFFQMHWTSCICFIAEYCKNNENW